MQTTPPAPPPAVAQAGRFLEGSFSSEHGARRYKLYVPSGYDGGRGVALVVMLHGCTQDPDDFARGTRMNARAEADTVLVVYPEQPASANPRKCWSWYDPAHQRRGAGEPALVEGITRKIMGEYRVDPARVFVAGVSAGAAMALSVAAGYPELYAAVGLHSGIPYGAAASVADALAAMQRGSTATDLAAPLRAAMAGRVRPMPAIVFQGGADAVVKPVNGEQLEMQLALLAGAARSGTMEMRQGFQRSLRTDGSGRSLVERWAVTALGHAWSGGDPSGTFTSADGPDASAEMLRFFREHPHPHPGQSP